MTFWVDADSCPRQVRDIVCRAGKRLSAQVVFAANRPVAFSREFSVKMVICQSEKDAADSYIAANAAETDIVITRDIPLARQLVDRNLTVINDRGTLFTKENIGERLSIRNFMLDLFNSGLKPESSKGYSARDAKAFADTFDSAIARLRARKT